MSTSRPLRVCQVVSYDLADEGGVKKHAVHLAAALRRRGDHVDIVGPHAGNAALPDGTTGFSGVVNIASNGSDNRMGILTNPLSVRSFMRANQYDIVHVHEPIVPILPWYFAWFSRGATRIATFHAFTEKETTFSKRARNLLGTPQLKLFSRAIAVSNAAAHYAENYWKRPLSIIPNGIDTALFSAEATPRAAEMPTPERPLKLLFVGHYRNPRKGLPALLRAHEELKQRGVPCTLDVVGNGDDYKTLSTADIKYHGPINDEHALTALFRACDIFVAPSTGMESFGIVLLEAMSTARPIVCSNIAGYRAVVGNEGAILVPPNDSLALADALYTLAYDPARRGQMATNNVKAAKRYDWDQVSIEVRALYEEALAAEEA